VNILLANLIQNLIMFLPTHNFKKLHFSSCIQFCGSVGMQNLVYVLERGT
jgi:hypothetical protein